MNIQYLHREDSRPTLTPAERREVVGGGFAELLLLPEGTLGFTIAH